MSLSNQSINQSFKAVEYGKVKCLYQA